MQGHPGVPLSPLYNTSRDDLSALWPHFQLDVQRISVVDAADPSQDRPAALRAPGDVLIAQVGYSPDVSLAVRSEYFLVSVEARQGTTLARARALLQRASSGRTWPTVVWQVVE